MGGFGKAVTPTMKYHKGNNKPSRNVDEFCE